MDAEWKYCCLKTSVSEDKFKNNQGILRHLENINSLVHQKQVFEMSRFEDQFSQYIDLAKDHLESFDIEEATKKMMIKEMMPEMFYNK